MSQGATALNTHGDQAVPQQERCRVLAALTWVHVMCLQGFVGFKV